MILFHIRARSTSGYAYMSSWEKAETPAGALATFFRENGTDWDIEMCQPVRRDNKFDAMPWIAEGKELH